MLRYIAFGITAVAAVSPTAAFADQSKGEQTVCRNGELLRAIRTIEAACADLTCDFEKLKELNSAIDRGTLMAVLRNPYLFPVHLFFPMGKTSTADILNWNTTKRDQLDSLKSIDRDSVVYVIGRASKKGGSALNRILSRERVKSVLKYLKETLRVDCHEFHGAWFGDETLYLTQSDASMLNIPALDYRNDVGILNQSVQIFVFPCRNQL